MAGPGAPYTRHTFKMAHPETGEEVIADKNCEDAMRERGFVRSGVGSPASEPSPSGDGGGDGEGETVVDREALAALKKDELQILCADHELDAGGTKAELIERLVEAGVSAPE